MDLLYCKHTEYRQMLLDHHDLFLIKLNGVIVWYYGFYSRDKFVKIVSDQIA